MFAATPKLARTYNAYLYVPTRMEIANSVYKGNNETPALNERKNSF